MSGFVVQVAVQARKELSGPLELLCHRGPDDSGTWVQGDNTFFMGHCRSSLFDLSEPARQPIADPFSSLHLVFDGEIYNYRELREELKGQHSFRTDTDTEVLLAAYRHWGSACLEKLNGVFAFVLWDEFHSEIFAARDHFGAKPLYYYMHKGMGVTLASEIKALHAAGGVLKSPNRAAWAAWLLHGLSDFGEETFWENIYTVPPGGWLSWSFSKGVQKGQWYNLHDRVLEAGLDERPETEVQEELFQLMSESLKRKYRSGSPVGACLSGTVDSSMMIGLIQRMEGRASQFPFVALKCDDPLLDSASAVMQVLQHTGHKLLFPDLRPEYIPDMLDGMKYYLDEPFHLVSCMSLAVQHYFANEQGLRILLWGTGLDEGWGGYKHYLEARSLGGVQPVLERGARPAWMSEELFSSARDLSFECPFGDPVLDLQYQDLRYKTLPYRLRCLDRISSAYSMGCRLPFLDYRVVELGFRQPQERRIHAGRGKYLPRRLIQGLLPDDFLDRPDLDASGTEEAWLAGPLSDWSGKWIEESLSGYGEDWLDRSAVLDAWKGLQDGSGRPAEIPVARLVSLGMFGQKPFFVKA